MHQVWRLGEYYEGNLGLACTKDGLFLGRTPLIERRGTRFAIRKRTEIERLLSRAYGRDLAVDRFLPGLATVAAALNANDPGLARIAAVHLRIPDLPEAAIDAAAALDFVKDGPHSLEDLQVSSNGYQEFSSYDQFNKGGLPQELLAKWFGPAGDGQQYHHVVTQGGADADNIPRDNFKTQTTSFAYQQYCMKQSMLNTLKARLIQT